MTINVINERLERVLDLLRKQTDIRFYIDDDVIDQSICADFENLSVGRGIKKMLEGTGINYAVIAKSGKIKGIFIGSSEKPQLSYGKLNTIPFRKQSTYRPVQKLLPPQPKQKGLFAPYKEPTTNQVKPVVTIPTAGSLRTSPILKHKDKEQ